MGWKEGVSWMGPPSNNPQKEGGYPPIPPLLWVVERARDLDTRRVYREPGKAQGIFTAKGHLVVHVWFLF